MSMSDWVWLTLGIVGGLVVASVIWTIVMDSVVSRASQKGYERGNALGKCIGTMEGYAKGLSENRNRHNDVFEFHDKFGCYIGDHPSVPDESTVALRLKLIGEEFDELCQAITDDDLPGIADAIVDLEYVLEGTAVSYGINTNPIWEAVHVSNMAKEGGATRDDGKILKPPGWTAPDVAGLIAEQIECAERGVLQGSGDER